tara:strand:+ start:566 stop:685 length:120 start_codon:yes stop_codon:yes gene_type:complete
MEHLFNCHGEWAAIVAFIGSWPLIGVWIRTKFGDYDEEG